ncbi:MAG: hypothetical protein AB7J28_12510 [Hyphomonadaceae bacterium]
MSGSIFFLEAAASEAADLPERHRALRAANDLQFDFPEYQPAPPPGWLRDLLRGLAEAGPILEFLFWAGVAAIAALILYAVYSEVRRQLDLRRGRQAPEEPAPTLEPAVARRLLADADALARDGRYAEAVHALLHRSIAEFDRRRPGAIRDSLTSREIARLPFLPDGAQRAFSGIAAHVERSFFGGRNVDANVFAECRAAYESFALSGTPA